MPTPLQLTPAAHALAAHLHTELRGRWAALPDAAPPAPVPAFQAAPIPDDLRGRRVELIVEASDLHALRHAITTDADALVIDFDDTFSPTRANVQAAYDALEWAATSGKPLLVRPRPLYATEPHLDFGGPGIAALCDLSAVLAARPDAPPHLYIPKLETVPEAAFWQGALTLAEAHLNLPANTVSVCLQIETFPGLLNAGALLHALHTRAYGLNAGRWDYVFSLIKHIGPTRTGPVPPRSQLTMDVPAMRAYAEHLVAVCREHGAEAIGGTASLAPDPADPTPALDAVRADKQREAAQGFTAAWAGLPELMDAVREGIASSNVTSTSAPTYTKPVITNKKRLSAQLTKLPNILIVDINEFRESLQISLHVLSAWLEGHGVVSHNGRIEDTATAELARVLLWHWVKAGISMRDPDAYFDRPMSRERYLTERRTLMPDNAGAARLLDHLVLSPTCPAYFPAEAQRLFPDPEGVSP